MAENLRALPNGHLLSDYRIDGVLGQGGFGITYLATDSNLGIKVAIKEYYPREFAVRDGAHTIRASGNDEDRKTFKWGLKRFLEEARTLARFVHPNIVAVRRFIEAHGTAYLVMDYCDGKPLDEIIRTNGPLSKEQLDYILFPLLDGLELIHASNFLHRDIKPANIYIRVDGSPLLLDFGAARQETGIHSRSVTSLATEGYAAIEQYSTRGKQGPWTDIYGLGATLYRAVTGEKPEDSTGRVLDDTLEPASKKVVGLYPQRLLKAIDAAMAPRPEQRPQNVADWREMFGTNVQEPAPPRTEYETLTLGKVQRKLQESNFSTPESGFNWISHGWILPVAVFSLLLNLYLQETKILSPSLTVNPTPTPLVTIPSPIFVPSESFEKSKSDIDQIINTKPKRKGQDRKEAAIEASRTLTSKMLTGKTSTEKYDLAISMFRGFYLINAVHRPKYCLEHNVKLTNFTRKFKEKYKTVNNLVIKHEIKNRPSDNDLVELAALLDHTVSTDMKVHAKEDNLTIEEVCLFIERYSGEQVKAIDFKARLPEVHSILNK